MPWGISARRGGGGGRIGVVARGALEPPLRAWDQGLAAGRQHRADRPLCEGPVGTYCDEYGVPPGGAGEGDGTAGGVWRVVHECGEQGGPRVTCVFGRDDPGRELEVAGLPGRLVEVGVGAALAPRGAEGGPRALEYVIFAPGPRLSGDVGGCVTVAARRAGLQVRVRRVGGGELPWRDLLRAECFKEELKRLRARLADGVYAWRGGRGCEPLRTRLALAPFWRDPARPLRPAPRIGQERRKAVARNSMRALRPLELCAVPARAGRRLLLGHTAPSGGRPTLWGTAISKVFLRDHGLLMGHCAACAEGRDDDHRMIRFASNRPLQSIKARCGHARGAAASGGPPNKKAKMTAISPSCASSRCADYSVNVWVGEITRRQIGSSLRVVPSTAAAQP